jgi:hypothetical protein
MIGQANSDAVEAVCDRRARGTASGEVRPEHKVVDEELRASTEKGRLTRKVNGVLDLDLQGFFEGLSQGRGGSSSNTPAARLIARGDERLLLLEEVEGLGCWRPKPSSWMHVGTSCATQTPSFHSQDVPCCSPSHAC